VATTPSPVYIKPLRQILGVSTAGSSGAPNAAGTAIVTTSAVSSKAIIADAVIEERHEDELVITEQPVAQGATITDHAFKLPAKLDLTYGWSAGSPQNASQDYDFLKNLYQQILGLQVSRALCQVFTGKRLYQNMLVKAISLTTDRETENSLVVRVTMQEALIANTQQVSSTPAAVQQLPQSTGPVVNQGNQTLQSAPTFNFGGVP